MLEVPSILINCYNVSIIFSNSLLMIEILLFFYTSNYLDMIRTRESHLEQMLYSKIVDDAVCLKMKLIRRV